jgi:hypothetical protein
MTSFGFLQRFLIYIPIDRYASVFIAMNSDCSHVRVIVLGDSGVGKTSFCRMMCSRDLPPETARRDTGFVCSFSVACSP